MATRPRTPEEMAQKYMPGIDFQLWGNDYTGKYSIGLLKSGEQVPITSEQYERISSYMQGIPFKNEPHPSGLLGSGYFPVYYDEIKYIYIQGVTLPPVDVVATKPTSAAAGNNAKILLLVVGVAAALILFNK